MKVYHFYDRATGILAGRTFSGPPDSVAANIPAGLAAVEGHYDHRSQRVDVAKAAADEQAHTDSHAATVAQMRAAFVPTAMPGSREFREPPLPLFAATAEHVIDYQPPQPSIDHEWNATTKRWQLSDGAQAKAAASAAATARIAALEAQSGPLVRKAVLGDEAARTALQGIEDEISAARNAL